MATEQGIIIKTDSDTAWTKTIRKSSCKGCSSSESCSESKSKEEMIVEISNPIGAKVGDLVIFSFNSILLFKVLFMMYVLPILCMIIGALAGHKLALHYNYNDSAVSAFFAFLFFFLAIFMIRIRSNKLSKKNTYKPKIIRIISKNNNII